MAGKKGRGGRPRLSAEQHALKGTFRKDRHGPLPVGVQPLRSLDSVPKRAPAQELAAPPSLLTLDDCPPDMSDAARAVWAVLIIERPTERLLAQLFAMHVQAVADWRRATAAIAQIGDLIRVGNRPVSNPHVALRRDAERRLLETARLLAWSPSAVQADMRADIVPGVAPRLTAFLVARDHGRKAERSPIARAQRDSAWTRLRAEVDASDALFFVGLVLIAIGCWRLSHAAAFIAVGAILLIVALPSRRPFIVADRTDAVPPRRMSAIAARRVPPADGRS